MIIQEFEIKRIAWRVIVLYDVDITNCEDIVFALTEAGCDYEKAVRAVDKLCDKGNNGLTYSNEKSRQSVVVIGVASSADEFANTYDHEKGHLVRHISQALGISPHGETEQYIAGYISQQMFKVAKRFLCDCCREKSQSFFRVFGI